MIPGNKIEIAVDFERIVDGSEDAEQHTEATSKEGRGRGSNRVGQGRHLYQARGLPGSFHRYYKVSPRARHLQGPKYGSLAARQYMLQPPRHPTLAHEMHPAYS